MRNKQLIVGVGNRKKKPQFRGQLGKDVIVPGNSGILEPPF